MIYDLIILGGGPAGVAAGVYAARKRLKTLVIAKEIGGQSTVSENIQNWIGTVSVSGIELGKSLKKHLLAYAEDVLILKEGEIAKKLERSDLLARGAQASKNFKIKTNKETYESKAVLITTGSSRRKLNVPGAAKFENRGVVYCASCDGPLFADMDVAVIGGGNAGFETAAQLLAYAKSVTLLEYGNSFKADKITVEKVTANPKMKVLLNADLKEIKGGKFVTGLSYKDCPTEKMFDLAVTGIFVEIGAVPATEYAKNMIDIDKIGQVVVDPRNQRTSADGIWAAGDCTNGLYHQNNIAMGDAVKALEDIYMWLQKK